MSLEFFQILFANITENLVNMGAIDSCDYFKKHA